MKNQKKYYVAAWLIAVAVFHVLMFLLPAEIINRDENRFWIVYGAVLFSFIGQAVCSLFYANKAKKEERFYYIPVVLIGYIALLVTFLLALQTITLQFLPDWFTIIVVILVFAYYALAVIRTLSAAEMICEIDKKVEKQTAFIRTLSTKANVLIQSASQELKPMTKQVYEALRYSDPMSSGELTMVEEDIINQFEVFSAAINDNQKEAAECAVQKIMTLIKERNELCKQIKR